MKAWFFKIGGFSKVNETLWNEMRHVMPEYDWHLVDIEHDIVRKDPVLLLRATGEAVMRYGKTIATRKLPPRDFFPRLPCVLDAVSDWVSKRVVPGDSAFTFQTQSLFDASRQGVPHFLFTDHTYLANLRYAEPRPLMPVSERWREMERQLYQTMTMGFTMSGFAERSMVEDYGVSDERVECVFSGCNIPVSDPDVTRKKSGSQILFAAVEWERKGGPELVDAFRQIRKEFPDARLQIVGCEPPCTIDGMTWVPRVAPAELTRYMMDADIFCMPSRMDPSATVLVEAAALGLPVVATPVGGNAERVVHGVTGFLSDKDELAGYLGKLLRDPELRNQMGLAGRKFVEENFTWSRVVAKMTARIESKLTQL